MAFNATYCSLTSASGVEAEPDGIRLDVSLAFVADAKFGRTHIEGKTTPSVFYWRVGPLCCQQQPLIAPSWPSQRTAGYALAVEGRGTAQFLPLENEQTIYSQMQRSKCRAARNGTYTRRDGTRGIASTCECILSLQAEFIPRSEQY
jgi:hypothetical protein